MRPASSSPPLAVGRGLQRDRVVGLAGLERLEHLFRGGVGRLGELVDGRRALQLGHELVDDLVEADVELLEAARHAHRPALVAEVALDLADDVGRRVGGELDAAAQVEAVDGLDEPDGADLDEVVEVLAARGVAARERAHQRQVHGDELLARRAVTVQVIAPKQVLVELLGVVAARGPPQSADGPVVRGLRALVLVLVAAKRRAWPGSDSRSSGSLTLRSSRALMRTPSSALGEDDAVRSRPSSCEHHVVDELRSSMQRSRQSSA